MALFWQIFIGNIFLLIVLITIHEVGHWSMGLIAGTPARHMKIRLLTFPQQVVLREGDEWVSVSDYDRYRGILTRHVPTRSGQYLYVVGGFLFESIGLAALATGLWMAGYWLFAVVAVGVSLLMYLIYLFAMDLPQSRARKMPWGDSTILYSLAPRVTLAVATLMILGRAGLGIAFLTLEPGGSLGPM